MRLAVMGLMGVLLSGVVGASEFVPTLAPHVWHQGHLGESNINHANVEISQAIDGKYTVTLVNELKPAYGLNDVGIFLNTHTGESVVYIPQGIDVSDSSGKFVCGKSVSLGKVQVSSRVSPDMVFCTSTLIDRVKEPIAQKGFSMMMKLASGITSAGTNVLDTFEGQLNKERLNTLITNTDVVNGLNKIHQDVLAEEAEQAKIATAIAAKNKVLFDKGQTFIKQAAVGETLCTSFDTYKVYAFIENVRGQKVQLRINRIIRVDLNGRDVKESTSTSGLTYRNGEIIWSDAPLWSACQ